jgi:hypothetical protein
MKSVFLILLGTCILMLTACVHSQNIQPSASASGTAEAAPVSPVSTPSVSASGIIKASAKPTSGSIIVESSNAVSDKQKQAILDDLSNQIDAAFSGSEKMEDLDNSDIDTNNIQ